MVSNVSRDQSKTVVQRSRGDLDIRIPRRGATGFQVRLQVAKHTRDAQVEWQNRDCGQYKVLDPLEEYFAARRSVCPLDELADAHRTRVLVSRGTPRSHSM